LFLHHEQEGSMFTSKSKPTEVTVTAIITRADGTVEDRGEIAYYHRNPWKRLRHKLKRRR
jgi:hypothetical protein